MKAALRLSGLLLLTACAPSTGDGNTEAAIANKATELDAAAQASVAEQIKELNAEANAAFAGPDQPAKAVE